MADYTSLTSQELIQLLAHFNLGELHDAVPLEGGQANSSIKLSTGKGEYTLSICDEKNTEDIDNLTDIMVYLEEQRFPATRLVKTKDESKFVFYGQKPVYVKKFIEGDVTPVLTPAMLQEVGRAMAALHQLEPISAMKDFFPYGLQAFADLLDGKLDHQYVDWLMDKKEFLEHSIDPEMIQCFIHGDIFWDNLVFNNDALVAVLDFEEACWYYKLFDLGMAAVGCCADKGCFDMANIQELLSGYVARYPLTSVEKAQLPVFIEYAAVSASFWRFRQYNVRRPSSQFAESYKELVSLADQIHTFTDKHLFVV
jgi:homoserine kinase type II